MSRLAAEIQSIEQSDFICMYYYHYTSNKSNATQRAVQVIDKI